MTDRHFKVHVRCMTFNHANYIKDAMNGFTMQQTTFPFICVIMDDASTDGEPEVIKRYLHEHFDLADKSVVRNEETDDYTMTFAQHKENKNCYFAVYFLKYNHYSIQKSRMSYLKEWTDNMEYSAICEGDDFWISPDFLQISVNFLDVNADYSCVFGNRLVCNEDATKFNIVKFEGDLTINDIMHGTNMGLRNLCFRHEINNVKLPTGSTRDLYFYYRCAVSGKMKYIDKNFAVYRYTGKGVCSSITGKESVYTRYQHYYQLHERTNFKYQEEYVNYQLKQLLGHIKSPSMFFYSLKLINEFHVPSLMRYWWYNKYLVLNLLRGSCRKLSKVLHSYTHDNAK